MLPYPEAGRALGVPVEYSDAVPGIRSFSIDTRTLKPGELFIALKGERSDGHAHVPAAYAAGASGVLIDRERKSDVLALLKNAGRVAANLLAVPEPERAMTDLARYYRGQLSLRAVSVTGSFGKTTTKEFLVFLLRQKYSALATSGNLNNHLGVPIMISRLERSHNVAVFELGASGMGEISHLAGLIRPSAAVITMIGPAHLEGFGSLENIYRAKTEVVRHLPKNAPVVISDQDPELERVLRDSGKRIVRAGPSEGADCRLTDVRAADGRVSFRLNGVGPFSFPGHAPFLGMNAALAAAMACEWGVPLADMPRDWRDAGFATGRFRETTLANGIRVIDDSYNASPLAFAAAVTTFSKLPATGKRILVFADMLELGAEELRYHRELGERISELPIDLAFAFGERARASIEAIRAAGVPVSARHFPDAETLSATLAEIVRPGDLVLFKGSRGMRVERVLTRIKELVFSTSH